MEDPAESLSLGASEPEPQRGDLGNGRCRDGEGQPAAGRAEHSRLSLSPALVRLALCCEFLLAVVAVYTLWSQVGGQYHLDLMAWPWKLGLGCGLAYVIVRATTAAMEHEKAWNARALRWLAAALVLALMIGAVTYYYHLNEPPEEDEEAGIQNALQL